VVTILNQIYEVDFKGFSYGFRPGRSPHQALDALTWSVILPNPVRERVLSFPNGAGGRREQQRRTWNVHEQ
jgi:retron-type reverse transcriptase